MTKPKVLQLGEIDQYVVPFPKALMP
jgi:hypothetical protein